MHYRYIRFPEGKAKAVTFSYDDGPRQDIRLVKLFNQYGMKATFNLNGDGFRKGAGITKAEVEEYMLSKGHEIAVHGYYHRAEGTCRPIEGIRDVLECRMELEQKYGRIIRGMAYPDSGITRFFGETTYESVKQYLKELDIVYSRTLSGDNNSFMLPTDWLQWMPTAHHDNPQLMTWIDEFLNMNVETQYSARRYARLCYIWGHSFEFDNKDNWDRIEEICKKFSGQKGVWFATNIEIYDYVHAYNSLVYSADETMVYNPTLMTVWFDFDGKLYSVAPGETIHIA